MPVHTTQHNTTPHTHVSMDLNVLWHTLLPFVCCCLLCVSCMPVVTVWCLCSLPLVSSSPPSDVDLSLSSCRRRSDRRGTYTTDSSIHATQGSNTKQHHTHREHTRRQTHRDHRVMEHTHTIQMCVKCITFDVAPYVVMLSMLMLYVL